MQRRYARGGVGVIAIGEVQGIVRMLLVGGIEGIVRREGLRGIQRIVRGILTGWVEDIVVALVLFGEAGVGQRESEGEEQRQEKEEDNPHGEPVQS